MKNELLNQSQSEGIPEINLKQIQIAAQNITHYIHKTPLIKSNILSEQLNTNIYLKLECLQYTGAFKVRGALNKLLHLSLKDQCNRRIIAVSAGNHGKAVVFVAQILNFDAIILMPNTTSLNIIQKIKSYGANVLLFPSLNDAFMMAMKYEQMGFNFIHPYDCPLIIAGQGTIGLEIIESIPYVTDVIVSIGGGGLISGIASTIKGIKSSTRIWGVEPEGAPSMYRSLKANKVVHIDSMNTIAKTLCAPSVAEITLSIVKRMVEKITLVSDKEMWNALKFIIDEIKIITEPAASSTLAAAIKLQKYFTPNDHVVLVLCGGSITLEEIIALESEIL